MINCNSLFFFLLLHFLFFSFFLLQEIFFFKKKNNLHSAIPLKTLKTDWDLGACTKRNSARKIYKSVIWQGQERQHLDSLRTQRRHTEKEKDREYKCLAQAFQLGCVWVRLSWVKRIFLPNPLWCVKKKFNSV